MEVAGLKPGDPITRLTFQTQIQALDYYSNYGYANMDVQVTRNMRSTRPHKYLVIEGKRIFRKCDNHRQ
jgi:hypothetical protein